MKVSILVPTYNSCKTLEKTLNSILVQDFDSFEIVLVDDGSNDDTKKLVESFDSSKIKYIYQENQGIAQARNTCLQNCSGDYVLFVDSDDYIEKGTIKKLYDYAILNDCEVVVFDYRYVYDDKTLDMKNKSFKKTSYSLNKELLIDVMPQCWNKLIKKEVFKRINTSFIKGLLFEDFYMHCCLIPNVKSIIKFDEVLLNYVQHSASIMANAKNIKKSLYDFDKIVLKVLEYYNSNNLEVNKFLEGLFVINAKEFINFIFQKQGVDKETKENAINSLLNSINANFRHWYRNEYYIKRYQKFGRFYLFKMRIIDYLLSKKYYRILSLILRY